jgi:hypothetical protein
MQTETDRTRNAAGVPIRIGVTKTSSNEFAVVDNCVASQEWQADFARIYAAREHCTSEQADRAASILCESLCLLPPLDAARTVMADSDLLAALRMATREAQEDWRSPESIAMDFTAVANHA